MIYVIWTDANGQVLHGWDQCTSPTQNKVTYQDTPLVHGPVPVGQETNPQTVRLSISKFPGAGTPTQPITNCVFKLVQYYGTGVTYSIPSQYNTYSFCGDGNEQDLDYDGYSGSNNAEGDLTTIGVDWPSNTLEPAGLLISMDGNCSFTLMRSDNDGVGLLATAGGSESGTDGQIDPNRYAEVAFKIRVPADYSGGALQILTSLEYIFTE